MDQRTLELLQVLGPEAAASIGQIAPQVAAGKSPEPPGISLFTRAGQPQPVLPNELATLLGPTNTAQASTVVPQSSGMSFNPELPTGRPVHAPITAPVNNFASDPTAQAAATMTAAGVKPPTSGPMAKPATAVPDRSGSMLPMTGGAMDSYYNDTPDPSQPLTAAGVQTPTQQRLVKAGQGLASGLQDIVNPQTEAPRPPAPVSPPGPTVRPDMSALMQTVLNSARTREPNPRQSALAAMLMRGFQ